MTTIETISRPDNSHVSTSFYKRPCARCDNGDYDDRFIGLRLLCSAGPELVIDNFDVDVFVNILLSDLRKYQREREKKSCWRAILMLSTVCYREAHSRGS